MARPNWPTVARDLIWIAVAGGIILALPTAWLWYEQNVKFPAGLNLLGKAAAQNTPNLIAQKMAEIGNNIGNLAAASGTPAAPTSSSPLGPFGGW
jgi:hypothetical protein